MLSWKGWRSRRASPFIKLSLHTIVLNSSSQGSVSRHRRRRRHTRSGLRSIFMACVTRNPSIPNNWENGGGGSPSGRWGMPSFLRNTCKGLPFSKMYTRHAAIWVCHIAPERHLHISTDPDDICQIPGELWSWGQTKVSLLSEKEYVCLNCVISQGGLSLGLTFRWHLTSPALSQSKFFRPEKRTEQGKVAVTFCLIQTA